LQYIVKLVRATRNWPGISRGAGPRAAIALLSAARAAALIDGSGFVTPDHVKRLFIPALHHRILLAPELAIEGTSAERVLQKILLQVETPRH
jgi:MoxR-like ATPase